MVHLQPHPVRDYFSDGPARVQAAKESAAPSFVQQLSEAFSEALQKVGINPGTVQITGQNPDQSGNPSQFVVSLGTPAVDPFAAAASSASAATNSGTAPGSGTASTSGAAGSPDSPQMTTLKNALVAAGIDPGSLNLKQVDDYEVRPFGGSYTNHFFQVQTPKGSQLFDVDMTMLNPQVTVVEIQNLLNPAVTWV